MRLGELEGIVGEEDGYSAESDAAMLLQGLDIPDALHERHDERAAGRAEGARAARAGALRPPAGAAARRADEPPRPRLDPLAAASSSIRYDGTLIVISHDRHFLNRVCTHIADIDYQTIITYTGGYDDMVIAKTQIRSHDRSARTSSARRRSRSCNDFIARFGAGTRASQVTSRRKEVERLQTTELARSNIQRPYIKFTMNRPSGRVALEFEGVSKAYGDLQGHHGLQRDRQPRREDRPRRPQRRRQDDDAEGAAGGRAGRAGRRPATSTPARCGGATRCRSATSRRITPARSQKGMTAVEWLHQFDPDASRQDIHGLLGQMLFSGEEGLKPTDALSGGETARLLFCRIMLQKPNVLVLDEPTNHLDLESINALNVALQKFEGTVFLVTHDQDLIEEVGTRVWHFDARPDRGLQGHLRGIRGDARVARPRAMLSRSERQGS